jgi:flagellar biosynthesis repressor protein FlbT
MGLKIELKPGERIILGECVVTNHDQRTHLVIEGNVPILREKDIITSSQADTPAKRIYYALQLMYTAKRPQDHHGLYLRLARDIMDAAPSTRPFIDSINNLILNDQVYKALKETRKLIAYERKLLDHALRRQGQSTDREEDGNAANVGDKEPPTKLRKAGGE